MRVIVPLPDRDFDTTEVAVPWHVLSGAGHEVVFATERGGAPAECDPRLLTGVLFGRLGAAAEPRALYDEMRRSPAFAAPVAWDSLDPAAFGALLLAGGHAPGMRQYLDSPALRAKVAAFWALERPVGAICHGVLVLARTIDEATGRSVLADRFTTCLPKYMEQAAHRLTAWRLGDYYRTYPAYVEDEVRGVLADPSQFVRGPRTAWRRGTATDHAPAFALTDGRYVSARWPGDAYLFAERLASLLARA